MPMAVGFALTLVLWWFEPWPPWPWWRFCAMAVDESATTATDARKMVFMDFALTIEWGGLCDFALGRV